MDKIINKINEKVKLLILKITSLNFDNDSDSVEF